MEHFSVPSGNPVCLCAAMCWCWFCGTREMMSQEWSHVHQRPSPRQNNWQSTVVIETTGTIHDKYIGSVAMDTVGHSNRLFGIKKQNFVFSMHLYSKWLPNEELQRDHALSDQVWHSILVLYKRTSAKSGQHCGSSVFGHILSADDLSIILDS